MNAKKRRSKKQSVANSKQPKPFVLYLDRNLGKYVIATALRSAGHPVEIHDDHLPIDAPDEDWIRLCKKEGWVAVTKDKNIRFRAAEIAAVIEHDVSVFVVRAKNATGPEIADLLVHSHSRLSNLADRTPAPFIAGIDRSGRITKYKI